MIVFLILAAYALLSTAWAADPSAAFGKSALFLGTVLITFVASNAIPALDEQQLRRAAFAFTAGAFAGALFVLFELLSGGTITRMAVNSVTSSISPGTPRSLTARL